MCCFLPLWHDTGVVKGIVKAVSDPAPSKQRRSIVDPFALSTSAPTMNPLSNTTVVSRMTVRRLKQELIQRGLPAEGLKPALIKRLQASVNLGFRLTFSPKLPTSVLLSILGQLGKKAGEREARVEGCGADGQGVGDVQGRGALGCGGWPRFLWLHAVRAGGRRLQLRRRRPGCELDASARSRRGRHERVPRLIEALTGTKVIGAAAGASHAAFWTDAGELFTFGNGNSGRLGHGGTEHELVPRLVQALVRFDESYQILSTTVLHCIRSLLLLNVSNELYIWVFLHFGRWRNLFITRMCQKTERLRSAFGHYVDLEHTVSN